MERQVISSRQNPLVKFVCGLADKKQRNKEGLFRFDGVKLLGEAILSGIEIKYVIYRAPASEAVEELIIQAERDCQSKVVAVSESVFEKISDEKSPEGVITVARMPSIHKRRQDFNVGRTDKLLIAESLRDPGNLGTVIRSCYALGIDVLIITDDCADLYNPRTVRAAMGALFRQRTVSVPTAELCELIGELRKDGRRVYATALSSSSVDICQAEICLGDCFIIGNEGHGLSMTTVEACTASVIIPMREDAESLNAAAAAAICIWETVKAK